MQNQTKQSATELFLKSWRVYQDIIQHNYMFHREIAAACHAILENIKPNQKLRVLDLGCGDASMALPLIDAKRIANYIGCDLSQPALDIAHQQLTASSIPHQLICDDMLRVATEQPNNSIDLVISSYAIHHLDETQKRQILQDIARLLIDNGSFVLIDIFREPTEDRLTYIHNYMTNLRSRWNKLSSEAQELVVKHATNYDFPETTHFYDTLCQQLGLSPGMRLSKHTWHEAWCFTNAA